tara:strand:- start:350 stop:1132 length:783 start_codon:yes stop_codon:yes gene_type:complete
MRYAGSLTARVLEAVEPLVQPGVTTLALDQFCHDYIVQHLKAIPGCLGQYDYPYTINTSVNEVVCHGWPSNTPLLEGDIVNIDVTVKAEGYYGDSSITFLVGEVSESARHLVYITQQSLYRAIAMVKPGVKLGDIGASIDEFAQSHGYSVVKEFCGHGIGQQMHEQPDVLHYGVPGQGMMLQEGMTFTIEPMINQGTARIKMHADGWTVTTQDKRLSAQFEHTILVTQTGFEVLTLRDRERKSFASYLDLENKNDAIHFL